VTDPSRDGRGDARTPPVKAGVVGVGSMGRNHARVYTELPGVELVGVSDVDADRAEAVASSFDTVARDRADLLAVADVASVAVPTAYHYEVARQCIEAGVDALVEKPLVDDLADGRELASMAETRDVIVQVGHVERFNPAVRALLDIVADLDPIAVEAHRLGPPLDRGLGDGVVLDLMIHDIDVLLALRDAVGDSPGTVDSVSALGTPDQQYATAQVRFQDGLMGTLTASRRTQKKVRTLDITAEDCFVAVDYLDQSIEIHRHSRPAYTSGDTDVRFRDERVIEQPIVNSGEPLKFELSSFVEAAAAGTQPEVTVDDALRAIEVANAVTDDLEKLDPVEATQR
jgi:predicted dehydrogenase